MLRTDTVIDAEGFDITPRYVPDTVLVFKNCYTAMTVVTSTLFLPAGMDRKKCPIRSDWNALELRTTRGSRWYGCRDAHINSELRMVVTGFEAGFEEMSAWEVCTTV